MKKFFGCCLSMIIVVIVLIGIAIGGFFVVFNMSFEKLHIADKKIVNGQSLRDMGLEKTSAKDMLNFVKSIAKGGNEENICTYKYTQQDKDSVLNKLDKTNIIDKDGNIKVENDTYVQFMNSGSVTFTDKEIAAYFNETIFSKTLEKMPFKLNEVKFIVNSEKYIKFVVSFDMDKFKENTKKSPDYNKYMEKALNKLDKDIFVTVQSQIDVDGQGRLITGNKHSIQFNEIPFDVSNKYMVLLSNILIESKTLDKLMVKKYEASAGMLAEIITDRISDALYSLGRIGKSENDLGPQGLEKNGDGGQITFVPWCGDNLPIEDKSFDDLFVEQAKLRGNAVYNNIAMNVARANKSLINKDTAEELITFINASSEYECKIGTNYEDGKIVADIVKTNDVFVLNAVYLNVHNLKIKQTGTYDFEFADKTEINYDELSMIECLKEYKKDVCKYAYQNAKTLAKYVKDKKAVDTEFITADIQTLNDFIITLNSDLLIQQTPVALYEVVQDNDKYLAVQINDDSEDFVVEKAFLKLNNYDISEYSN